MRDRGAHRRAGSRGQHNLRASVPRARIAGVRRRRFPACRSRPGPDRSRATWPDRHDRTYCATSLTAPRSRWEHRMADARATDRRAASAIQGCLRSRRRSPRRCPMAMNPRLSPATEEVVRVSRKVRDFPWAAARPNPPVAAWPPSTWRSRDGRVRATAALRMETTATAQAGPVSGTNAHMSRRG